jgi:hypothetical protein
MAVINAESNNFRIGGTLRTGEIGCEKAVCGIKRAACRRTANPVIHCHRRHIIRWFRGRRICAVPNLIIAIPNRNNNISNNPIDRTCGGYGCKCKSKKQAERDRLQ